MLRKGTENKYESPFSGPHEILAVNMNGTVCLQIGSVIDTINIRRIQPYVETPDPIMGASAICDFPRGKDVNEIKAIHSQSYLRFSQEI